MFKRYLILGLMMSSVASGGELKSLGSSRLGQGSSLLAAPESCEPPLVLTSMVECVNVVGPTLSDLGAAAARNHAARVCDHLIRSSAPPITIGRGKSQDKATVQELFGPSLIQKK